MSFCSGNILALLILTMSVFAISMPANAFTCDDVRGLSTAQQNYWSKRLHLSSEQRHIIWVACYRDYRPPAQELVRR
ncbi:MAG: hypothetical protein ACRECE_03340, partial [Xanthobacteraceae bacterium]